MGVAILSVRFAGPRRLRTTMPEPERDGKHKSWLYQLRDSLLPFWREIAAIIGDGV